MTTECLNSGCSWRVLVNKDSISELLRTYKAAHRVVYSVGAQETEFEIIPSNLTTHTMRRGRKVHFAFLIRPLSFHLPSACFVKHEYNWSRAKP